MTRSETPGGSRSSPSSGCQTPPSRKLESLFWTLCAVGVLVYGSGKHDLVTLLLTDKRLNRLFVWFGFINVVFNILLFLYVYGWMGYVRGVKDPVRSGTLAVPAGAVTFATTIVSFISALWPVFGLLSILQVVVVTYGIISSLAFLPGIGPLRVDGGGTGQKRKTKSQ